MSVHAGEYRVWPMLIEAEAAPGSTYQFEFNIYAHEAGTVRVYEAGLKQLESGYVEFVSADRQEVFLSQPNISLKKSETVVVTGSVMLPRLSADTLYAIMIEDVIRSDTYVNLNVRYAVVLSLSAGRNKLRGDTKILNVEIKDGEIFALIVNNSNHKGRFKSIVHVRQNKRLVDKLTLLTEAARQRGEEDSLIYPGATVRVSAPLEPGDYSLLIRSQFNGRSLPILRH